tara:strand:+ start:258 stop:1400 length:1143 start_codon:yes stop_codon:yes gene_type:complete
MSNYTTQITWSGKDALSNTDPEKIISGADYNTEFLAIQTAVNSKLDITGGVTTGQNLTNAVLNTGVSGSAVLDEDNMASNSATKISTQQSIKAYVDTTVAGSASTTEALTNKTINLASNTMVGTLAQFNTAVSDATLVDLDDSQVLVNKTLTAPVINGAVGGTATSQTITTLTTSNIDGILGANTPAAVTGTTGSFSGAITASTTPSNANHLTNKTYVDNLFAGMASRSIVTAATTANITIATALNNGDTLDGVTLSTGDLVLVKDQSTASQNGIYVVGSSPARDDLFDTYNEHPGSLIVITEGTVNADHIYICTSDEGGSLDSTGITWAKVTPAATSLNNLTDVTISSPVAGQAIVHNGSTFVNGSAGVGVGLAIALGG